MSKNLLLIMDNDNDSVTIYSSHDKHDSLVLIAKHNHVSNDLESTASDIIDYIVIYGVKKVSSNRLGVTGSMLHSKILEMANKGGVIQIEEETGIVKFL